MPFAAYRNLIAAITAVAVISTASATLAASKPQVSIRTKAAEITVMLDDALRRHPGLAENLLAEGRRWADKQRAEAQDVLRQSPGEFSEGRKWTLAREYTSRSVVGRYVSVVRSDDTYTGGAHPNTAIDTILWDRDTRKRLSVRPFLKETADNGPTMTAMAKLVRIAVAREKIARDIGLDDNPASSIPAETYAEKDSFIAEGVKPTLPGLGPVTFAPSTERDKSAGLTFHFEPYAVGAYAEGSYTAFVPWSDLKPYLSAQGVAIFGGERPESDKKK